MAKKIFDILPPKELKRKRKEKELFLPEKRKKFLPRTLPSPFRRVLILFLILIGIFSYFALPKAEIEIWPETEVLTFEEKLTIDKSLNILNFTTRNIPGKIFEVEKAVLEEFSSSGKKLKENKAEGVIRVYNAYSTSSQVLVATTRFVSTGGKLFRSIKRVTIPGGHYEEGNLIPGFLDIKVRADQPGSDFDIEPTTFSIPGFIGTPRYTTFYGKSFQPMTGGFQREVPQVTQEDLDQAEDIIIERATEESRVALREKIPPEFVLLKEAVKSEILEFSSSAKVGDESEKFILKTKIHSSTLTFKARDIEDWTRQFILSQTPEGKKLYQESLKINYVPELVNLESGKTVLSLTTSAIIYSYIDELTLKRALRGKSLAETQVFLENQSQVTKAVVKFWPFWVKRVPQNEEKINFKLTVD